LTAVVTISGNLGRDPEVRNEGKITTLAVAVNNTGKKDAEGKYCSEWYKVDIWGKQAENAAEWLKKGNQVTVIGKLKMDTYESQGTMKTTPHVSADHVVFPPRSKDAPVQQKIAPPAAKPTPPPAKKPSEDLDAIFASEDEIPF
jgi:single-strand DNA-binding protein